MVAIRGPTAEEIEEPAERFLTGGADRVYR